MSTPSRAQRAGELFTLVVTNATKLIGAVSAFKQLLLVSNPKNSALWLSFALVVGGQAIENLVFRLLDKLLQDKGFESDRPDG